jgi:hypothetical protein
MAATNRLTRKTVASHGFVIDREEAKDLFTNVERPPDKLFRIGEEYKALSSEYLERGEEFVAFLNDRQRDENKEPTGDPNHAQANDGQADGSA